MASTPTLPLLSGPDDLTRGHPVAPVLWHEQLNAFDYSFMVGLPSISLVLLLFILRIWWRPKSGPKFRLPKQVPTYGTLGSDTETHQGYEYDGESNDLIYAGQVAGHYDTRWAKTFDLTFLIGLVVFKIVLIVLTTVYKPSLWSNTTFWLSLLPKLVIMMTLSTVGGIVCRWFCIVDDRGYVITERNSKFKVNFTRKLQLLAAYVVPLLIKPDASCDCEGALELAWGDYVTLVSFLLMIKPIRERFRLFMIQFNSIDRPEDRPHTLKWMVAGTVFPALVVLLLFRSLFAQTTQSDLVFILVFITSIGDGLAEPIGTAFGKHKYSTSSCLSKRKYTRSYEGSAVVFLSGMIFPALQYFDFKTAGQLWLTMVVLPFVAAYAEATAPHTMDAPVLMLATGTVLYVIIHAV